MKTFIFITSSGTAYDDNNIEQQNCQHLITGQGETAQKAWENCRDEVAGSYDDISAFELVSDRAVCGNFELGDTNNDG